MELRTPSSPHVHAPVSVVGVMTRVLAALIPGIIAYVWFFGPAILVNILFACLVALATEALMLRMRRRPLQPFLSDGSALLSATLLALALPPLAPWWLTLLGVAFGIGIGKHLYGGLGYNPFNPAMVGYVVLLISFPREMTTWQPLLELSQEPLGLAQAWQVIFGGGAIEADALTAATPLDHLKTQLGLDQTVDGTMATSALYGMLGGVGWEWINLGFLAGGIWLAYRRLIGWQIPVGMLAALAVLALIFHLIDPARYASPLFHLFSGATMLGAFFIATDPVSAATTARGRLYFGLGVGVITYIIRAWGGYPDGVAFGVLLMNLAAPLIDHYTKPRTFGHNKR